MVPFERPTQQRKVPVDAGALPSGRHRLILGAGLTAVLIAAAVVRFVAARDEFWLDEIWSLLAFARATKSPLDVFTQHHDNNHYLVTLWMYLVGAQRHNWFIYRIPSLVAGIGTVALAAQVGRRWGTFATLAASIVTGASYVLIVYASEARGYALAGFFALVAFLALDRFLATRSSAANLLFVVACVLGFLSHLTFIEFYFGAALWSFAACRKSAPSGIDQQKAGRKSPSTRRPTSARKAVRGSQSLRGALHSLARLHAVPICFLAALYLLDIRAMRVGGGDAYVMRDVLARAAALAVGVVAGNLPTLLAASLVTVALAVAALVLVARDKADVWIFFAATIFVAPALLFTFHRPTLLYERYFYLNILFFLLLSSYLLDRVFRLGAVGRYGAIAALALFLSGNVLLTGDFLQVGRGHYLDALRYIESHSSEPELRVAGDDEFDNTKYLGFYAAYLPEGRRVSYHDFHKRSVEVPEWVILHGQAQPYDPPPSLRIPHSDVTYALERVFPCAGLSGYNFAVYRSVVGRGQ